MLTKLFFLILSSLEVVPTWIKVISYATFIFISTYHFFLLGGLSNSPSIYFRIHQEDFTNMCLSPLLRKPLRMAVPGNKELNLSYRMDSGEKAWSTLQAMIPRTKAMTMWHLRRLPISKATCACVCTQTHTYTHVDLHSPHTSGLLVSRLV